VVIAGAGLAGSALALLLARRGVHVALVDHDAFPRDKLCGEFLSPEGWGFLERLGVAGSFGASQLHWIKRVRLTTPRGRSVVADVRGGDGLAGVGLSRHSLDHALVCAARAAGVCVFEKTRVGKPLLNDGCVTGLNARHPEWGPIELKAMVTVAAIGRNSALVRETGQTRARAALRPRLFGMKRHLSLNDSEAGEPAETVGLHLVGGGYVGACLVGQTSTNLCALLPERWVREQRGDLDRLVMDRFSRNPVLARLCAASAPVSEWKTVAGIRVEVSEPRLPGVFYAGDCQGTVDPLAGQGMTMALLGAEVLTSFVMRALCRGEGADRRLQRAYQAAWHRRFDRRVRLCSVFHHALAHPASIDLASTWGSAAASLLSTAYQQTRDYDHVV
jgi:flavin-dependent dehydrogenase